ncbi:MAG: branched-chain-amino-acid transaminase [Verrucomicrobia bacterium]|nr:branched-chain-amino-acid transaminase [Verrucomicrobiota bacterium]
MKIYIDGRFYSEHNAKISVFDHGVLYGDGVFEGIRFYNGRIFKLEEHVNRLFASAQAILLTIPMSKEEVAQATIKTCRLNKLKDGYIRLVVTRGVGYLGLSPYKCKKASVFIIAATIELYPESVYRNGLKVATTGTMRPPGNVLSPAVKSLNYLNNIMGKIECLQAGADEGLMLNAQGNVAECTGDNIFIVKDNTLITPPTSAGALDGITRRTVMALAAEAGLPVREENLTRYDVFTADECFLTGTAAEVVPVTQVDGRIIGGKRPGPVTLDLMQRYRELTAREGAPIYL